MRGLRHPKGDAEGGAAIGVGSSFLFGSVGMTTLTDFDKTPAAVFQLNSHL